MAEPLLALPLVISSSMLVLGLQESAEDHLEGRLYTLRWNLGQCQLWFDSCTIVASRTEADIRPRRLKRVPFYAHISSDQARQYQSYINRAFELSLTLEFEEKHHLLVELLAEVANRDSLSELDLELMRLQYVCADRLRREEYRSNWVKKVMNLQDTDFFPDPWTIIQALFAKQLILPLAV